MSYRSRDEQDGIEFSVIYREGGRVLFESRMTAGPEVENVELEAIRWLEMMKHGLSMHEQGRALRIQSVTA